MNQNSAPPRSRTVFNVEMDDRTVLFPDGKFLSHIAVSEGPDGLVRLEAVFHFNESRADPLIAVLHAEDARDLARAMLEAVFQGRTQHVLSDEVKVAVVFNPNGFLLRFGEDRALKELFIASPAIVRFAQGVLRTIDRIEAFRPH